MTEEKLSVSDRNGRYLLVFSFVSVVLILLNKSMGMLENELSKVYISQSSIPYLKMTQTIPSVLWVSCIFLLIPLIRYIYFEASTFIKRTDSNLQIEIEEKADKAYKHILYYLMMFGLVLATFFLCSVISEIMEISKINYAATYSIIIIISSIFSVLLTRKYFSKQDRDIPHIATDGVGGIVFLLFCLSALTTFFPQQSILNVKVSYDQQYVKMDLEGNGVYDKMQVLVNDKLVQDMTSTDEDFFISKYVTKDISDSTTSTDSNIDVFVEQGMDYFYSTNIVDISNYINDGSNDVVIYLEINGRTYIIKNPLNVNDKNYKYLKSDYESDIIIKK